MMPSVLLPILSGVAALDILDLGLHAVTEPEPFFCTVIFTALPRGNIF